MNADTFDKWYRQWDRHFEIARDILNLQIGSFVTDWSEAMEFRCDRSPTVRIKRPHRLLARVEEKKIDDVSDLLRQPFPITDIVGGRVVVRTLDDASRCREAVEAYLAPDLHLGPADDKILAPTGTGYRAIHFDGYLEISRSGRNAIIPLELQIKTLVQDCWGHYTHDGAYERSDFRDDRRFAIVRDLQHTIADQLHNIDELQARVEDLSAQAVSEIRSAPIGEELDLGAVLNIAHEVNGDKLRIPEGLELLEVARRLGVTTTEEFRALVKVDETTEEIERVVERWRDINGRKPRRVELLASVLESRHPSGPHFEAEGEAHE